MRKLLECQWQHERRENVCKENVPASACCIILTSLPPSPMAHVRLSVCCWMSDTTCAFCVGLQRQQTTAGHEVASSINSYW